MSGQLVFLPRPDRTRRLFMRWRRDRSGQLTCHWVQASEEPPTRR